MLSCLLFILYRCIHVSPVTEPSETREELKLDNEEENGNRQDEKLIQREIDGFENEHEKSRNQNLESHPKKCAEDTEFVTCF